MRAFCAAAWYITKVIDYLGSLGLQLNFRGVQVDEKFWEAKFEFQKHFKSNKLEFNEING